MSEFLESENIVLSSDLRKHFADRLSEVMEIKSMRFSMSGDGLKNAKNFANVIQSLRRQGVKISHDVSITLEFPKAIHRKKALDILGEAPKPLNGSLKIRMDLNQKSDKGVDA